MLPSEVFIVNASGPNAVMYLLVFLTVLSSLSSITETVVKLLLTISFIFLQSRAGNPTSRGEVQHGLCFPSTHVGDRFGNGARWTCYGAGPSSAMNIHLAPVGSPMEVLGTETAQFVQNPLTHCVGKGPEPVCKI